MATSAEEFTCELAHMLNAPYETSGERCPDCRRIWMREYAEDILAGIKSAEAFNKDMEPGLTVRLTDGTEFQLRVVKCNI